MSHFLLPGKNRPALLLKREFHWRVGRSKNPSKCLSLKYCKDISIISSITNTGTITLPTSTDTLVGKATTDTLTNKSISGSSNTLTNIPNSALTNSSITINGSSVSLGGSTTIDAGVFNETIVTPTANQTTFTTAYTVNYVQVFVNGIKLLNGVDFTATNGTSIVLTSGVSTTDRVEIVKFKWYLI